MLENHQLDDLKGVIDVPDMGEVVTSLSQQLEVCFPVWVDRHSSATLANTLKIAWGLSGTDSGSG